MKLLHDTLEEGDTGLRIYLRDISYNLYKVNGSNRNLTAQEEAQYAKRIKEGDKEAIDTLVKCNLRFVVSTAKNYRNQGMPLSDMINEGNIGLIKAAYRFDEKKNFKFISYAVWWVRQAILEALADQSRIVKVPLNKIASIYKIGKARINLEVKYNRLPDEAEIADETGLDKKDVKLLYYMNGWNISMDSPLKDTKKSGSRYEANEEDTYMDVYHDKRQEMPDDSVIRNYRKKEIYKALECLSTREKEIIKHYFGIDGGTPQTLEEIGSKFRITRERIRQIKTKALEKLKGCSMAEVLKMYL